LRAPANLFLAGPALFVKLASWAGRRAGNHRLAAWLAGCRLLVETDVAHEVEWLVATELLEIPCRRRDRAAYRDAIAETILADSRAAERLGAQLNSLAGRDPEFRGRVLSAIENYRDGIAEDRFDLMSCTAQHPRQQPVSGFLSPLAEQMEDEEQRCRPRPIRRFERQIGIDFAEEDRDHLGP